MQSEDEQLHRNQPRTLQCRCHTAFAAQRTQNLFCPRRCLEAKCMTDASNSAPIMARTITRGTQLAGSASSVPKIRFRASLGRANSRQATANDTGMRSEETAFIATSIAIYLLQDWRLK